MQPLEIKASIRGCIWVLGCCWALKNGEKYLQRVAEALTGRKADGGRLQFRWTTMLGGCNSYRWEWGVFIALLCISSWLPELACRLCSIYHTWLHCPLGIISLKNIIALTKTAPLSSTLTINTAGLASVYLYGFFLNQWASECNTNCESLDQDLSLSNWTYDHCHFK